ncbi:MAG: ROK family protein [Phycisphaerae bacterium]|nr:ROK family protein [Phycisphaerae bacterium]
MNPNSLILGWDVGGTKSAAVVGDANGRVLERVALATPVTAGPEPMIAEFLDVAARLRAGFAQIAAVGVSIGGPVDTLAGVVQSPPHLPGWHDIALRDRLAAALEFPVVVEHDAVACLLAEWFWGAARGTTHCAYLTCGTGFGAGLMIDSRIVRGPGGRSPEFGHVRLAADGPEAFGKPGCCESFCSGQGIARLAPFMFPRDFDAPCPTAELVRRRDAGDKLAADVLAESARRLGQACAILADLFSPQVIVLGSLSRHFGPRYVEDARAAFAAEALPINATATRIVPYELDNMQDLSPIAACRFRMGSPE